MLGDLTINVSLSASVLLAALWITARHEADLDWSKLMIVSAITGVLTVLPPLFIWSSLVEHFHWDLLTFWPLILLATLAWQIGVFVVMLNRYVWVPIPKALLAWFVVQALLIAKDSVFTLLRGGSLVESAWTSVTGMQSPSEHREAKLREAESERKIKELQDAAREGNMDRMIAAVEARTAPPATTAKPTQPDKPATNQPPPTHAAAKPAPAATPKPQAPKKPASKSTPKPAPAKPASANTVSNITPTVSNNLTPAMESAYRQASRELLVVNGMSQQGGLITLVVNGQVVQVGGTATVNYKGHRFTWRLVAVEDKQPVWE